MTKILVTGGKGQLGQCLQSISNDFKTLDFVFLGSNDLDISNNIEVEAYFKNNTFDYCINCAAYTAVDKAEEEQEKAKQINEIGAKNLAHACFKNSVTLIHISTDFVFDGTAKLPYTEEDRTNPISVYGKTKRDGELAIISNLPEHFIIRTSWLYSEFGSNFVKTMLRLSEEKKELSVVDDQTGCPTYAKDLAEVILKIIDSQSKKFGIYHYSNQGQITWYDFAKEIFKQSKADINLYKTDSKTFKTLATRPKHSVLNTSKIHSLLKLEPIQWKKSLETCLTQINK
ncbi:dTDP-4-dehydrorhamnose reductase [Mesoflavibacter sabulilitoris]|uniref:dTDP-4-dehydrorhamnose reductase n=1 Tax=Mesoflavibacter zeaxanthinifaciens subsp. sabulilitoris TaxID=1520893 RepID=A0A2T1N6H5_9FLAO|nr:dTDP-4-dehydrorhamnose reductase [Mesoflavibacter zeaxanthinifaciens]MBB3123164.1 dTDP-4-dehydrorhamnose reductase [Mesoflavibacter zeaxanthinifaciens subsp. sabulilitoris]PSG87196.1 dTDP-4-dehydrorhamnose reductase [Mesoflavibacter zeaxanthinifaciens subsp. sabulilitoris]